MSITHEQLVHACLVHLDRDTILTRAIRTVPTYVATTLIGNLQNLYGVNRTDARIAAFSAMEIAENNRDLAKPRAKA